VASVRGDSTVWSRRTVRWVIVAVHFVILSVPPAITSFGLGSQPATGPTVIALPLGLAVLVVQLRHSFAIAQGRRPPGVLWTMLLLAILVYVPLAWFGWSWVWMQASLMASLPMVLRNWPLALALAAPIVGTDLAVVQQFAKHQPVASVIFSVFYTTFSLVALSAALYGSARLVRVLDELQSTRAELAGLAVGRERLRVSRDLHDLLGQSLSAISLKGELAIRLLRNDPSAARVEIEGLTGVAQGALRGVRAVARDEHIVSLRTEIDGAAALLRAAGIDTRVDVDVPKLPRAVEEMLGWGIREGITNVLRHSQARTCSIKAARRNGSVWLEIENDGAPAEAGHGTGLASMAERAKAISGSLVSTRSPDGRFRLLIEVPEEFA
jgi:two-component system, NarL family, sensor histidine kinase DesK